MNPITVLVADDHHLVRAGLCALLRSHPDFRVVAEASDGLEAVRLTERVQPDVAVLDVMMPGLNGLGATARIHRRSPRTKVVMVSMHAGTSYAAEAVDAGAIGYVLKDSTAADLATAVRAAAAGRQFLSPPLSLSALEAYRRRSAAGATNPHRNLTARELEVLQLVAEGRTNAETGGRLGISPRTVEAHRARVSRKLSCRTTADLVRFALRHGVIPDGGDPGIR